MNGYLLGSAVGIVPLPIWIVASGAVTGVASMLVYRRTSRQQQIRDVTGRAHRARQQLKAYAGEDFAEFRSLAGRALILSLTQFRLSLLPTSVAMALVLAVAYWMEMRIQVSEQLLWSVGPTWLASGATAFWGSLCLSACAAKFGWDIK